MQAKKKADKAQLKAAATPEAMSTDEESRRSSYRLLRLG